MSLQPMKFLKESIRAVPAVKYALGVGGIVSVVAIVSAFGISPQWAVIGTVVTLVLMVALLVFAKLTTIAPGNFLLPVKVLMWSFLVLTIATAGLLFSSVFFKWPAPLPELFGNHPQKVEQIPTAPALPPIEHLLQAAAIQTEAADYEGAWNALLEALKLQPSSAIAHQQQIHLAMVWLDDLHIRGTNTFANATDLLLPALTQGAVQARGQLAGDLLAHIGWAYFLKSCGGIVGMDILGQYKRALAMDPENPYAHAMWGHWLGSHGEYEEAKSHFAAALQSGREREYVRRMQLATLQWGDNDEKKIELLRVANEMRLKQEILPLENRRTVLRDLYWAASPEFSRQLRTSLPTAEHLATFRWLAEGVKIQEDHHQTFALAQLTEDSGDYAQALILYKGLLLRPGSYEAQIKAGVLRCEKKTGKVR